MALIEFGRYSVLSLLFPVVLLLGACAGGQPVVGPSGPDQKAGADTPNALQVSDIPLPAGAKLDTESSLIIGANDRWLGRLVIKTDLSSVQAFNHFYNGMGGFGWGLITVVQAKVSNLTYARGERVAAIQIEPAALGGTTVSVTVSTRQPAVQEPARPK